MLCMVCEVNKDWVEWCVFLCHGMVALCMCRCYVYRWCFFFQAEDGIRDAQESRGLGDVYKRQALRSSV